MPETWIAPRKNSSHSTAQKIPIASHFYCIKKNKNSFKIMQLILLNTDATKLNSS